MKASWCQIVGWLLLLLPVSLLGEAQKYRGFTIDDSAVRKMPNVEVVRAATREQIDMVCAVGLPQSVLTFFQSVPFEIVPPSAMPGATPGLYSAKDRSVRVTTALAATGHKPVLLHELLHAYHDQQLARGFNNPEIAHFYDRAKAISAYASTSHMMQNDREYFACSATTYLFGVTAQEPFKRAKISENQPDLVAYLKKLFGPNAGVYAGSLTQPPDPGNNPSADQPQEKPEALAH